jgi:hypothetical protein
MRFGALMVTVVAASAFAQPVDPCTVEPYKRLPRCVAAQSFQASASATTSFSGRPIGTGLPCTGVSACLRRCYVTSGTTYACFDNTGASVETVSQGTSPTAEDTFAPGRRARSNVTDANAPTIATSTVLSNMLAGDFTAICMGIAHANGITGNSAYVSIGHATAIDNVFSMFVGSGNFTCSYGESGSYPSATVPAPAEGWAVVSCRRSGNNRIARVNGTDGTTTSTAGVRGIDAGLTVGIGRERPGAAGRNQAGPSMECAFYGASMSSTFLRYAENVGIWGVSLDAGAGNSGMVGLLNDAGTDVDFFAGGAHVVSPDRGLRTVGQTSTNADNNWAADPFDVSSWTNVGTPLVGASGIANPFSRWQQATGCYNLEDNDNAAFEGKESAELQRTTNVGAAHAWNVRVWASIGDAGTTRDRMRLVVRSPDGVMRSDAGGEEYCDFTLDGTVRPYDCTAQTTDAGVTTVKGRVLVGNTAATTGSVTVCHAQDTPMFYPQLALASSTAFGAGDERLDPSGWPSTSLKGKYEVVFTPLWNINTQWDNGAGVLYLLDAYTNAPVHSVVLVGGYQMAGRFLARVTNSGGSATEFLVDGVSLTPGQRYAASMEWRPRGAGRCRVVFRMNSCAGSAASCTATTILGSEPNGYCPAQPAAARIGNRYDDTVPTSVFVDAVRVYQ